MKKFIWLMLTAVLMLTPMTSFAAEKADASEYKIKFVQTITEVSDWKSLSDEDLTEAINNSTDEEVGWFLLGLSDEEFEAILLRESPLIYPVMGFSDTGEFYYDETGEKWPVQKKEILADNYYEYAIKSVMSVFSWADNGYYTGTADGMWRLRIYKEGSQITSLKIYVYDIEAGEGSLSGSQYKISGTLGSWSTKSVKSEKENGTWAGVVLNGTYTKPAHYYTYWDADIYYNGRLDPWNSSYTDYTLSTTHRTSDYTDTVRIQCNALNAGMIDGYEETYGEGTGYIELERHKNALKINPNGGTHGGNTSTYTLATKKCMETTTVADPTRVGYEFTGWTLTNGTAAGGALSGTTFTHCNSGSVFDTDTDVYSYTTATTTLKANWVAKDYPYEVRHYKQLADGTYPTTPDETETGVAGNDSSFTGPLKSYPGCLTPNAQTITIGSGNNIISYYYQRNSFDLTVDPNGGTWRGNATPTSLTILTGESEIIADPIPPVGANVTLYYHDDDEKVVTEEVRSQFSHWEKSGGGTFDAATKKFTSGNGNASLTAQYTGGSITLPVLSREHYTFMGWDTEPDIDPDTETPDYQPGATVPVNSDMELHAIWKVNFELDAYIERVLSPHDPVFENGEMGVLKVSLVGFVNKVEVTFPYEMSRYDDTLSTTHTLTPKIVDEVTQEFYVPLYSAEDGYRVTVTAYNEEGESLTVYPNLTTVGSILDDFRTRLR